MTGFIGSQFFELSVSSLANAGFFDVKSSYVSSGSIPYSSKDQTFIGTFQKNGNSEIQTAEIGGSFASGNKSPKTDTGEISLLVDQCLA